jgi:hypothetical protein
MIINGREDVAMMPNGIIADWLKRCGASHHPYRYRGFTRNLLHQPAPRSSARGIVFGVLLGMGFWIILAFLIWR